jgi:tripeptidyl-peptidase-1
VSALPVCSVGATYLDAASGKEVGATLSSGGFSKGFYRPSWQDAAVASYFASAAYKAHPPHETFYAEGRAYPDVAAFGQNVQVVAAGKAEGVSGTSCSAPIFAGATCYFGVPPCPQPW